MPSMIGQIGVSVAVPVLICALELPSQSTGPQSDSSSEVDHESNCARDFAGYSVLDCSLSVGDQLRNSAILRCRPLFEPSRLTGSSTIAASCARCRVLVAWQSSESFCNHPIVMAEDRQCNGLWQSLRIASCNSGQKFPEVPTAVMDDTHRP